MAASAEVKVSRYAPERRSGKKFTDLVYQNALERLRKSLSPMHAPIHLSVFLPISAVNYLAEFRAILLFIFSVVDLFLAFPSVMLLSDRDRQIDR